MQRWKPTHRITLTRHGLLAPVNDTRTIEVMLIDGAAYTNDEWDTETTADWEVVDGQWLFQGRAAPHGYNSVEVCKL